MKIGYICRIVVCLVVVIAALLGPSGKGFWFGILRHCLQLLKRDDHVETVSGEELLVLRDRRSYIAT